MQLTGFLQNGPFLLIIMGVLQAVSPLRLGLHKRQTRQLCVSKVPVRNPVLNSIGYFFVAPNSGTSWANRGLPLPLGRGVCQSKSTKTKKQKKTKNHLGDPFWSWEVPQIPLWRNLGGNFTWFGGGAMDSGGEGISRGFKSVNLSEKISISDF